eukprot:NODE_258_length_12622_cov_0.213767.p2 type:complete len:786 gc:universal NODE_258_length_12622_cov_0.213767:3416-5773(+)
MGKKSKIGKHRMDKYYHLAKEQGFRSRAAFKLIQLNRKYNFLSEAKVLIDLCASPGGFLQVAAKEMPESSIIVGVDLVPIKSIPGVITFQGDITTQTCRSKLRGILNDWKADVVCNDGAPNVGASWSGDAFVQNELTLSACKLACEFLKKNGTFITKVFRSKDYQALMWVFNQLFGSVEATKPSSSRNESAEIFVVCRNFKAPVSIDPKLLDAKYVFQDLLQNSRSSLKKILNPEKQTRQRNGYDDDNMILFKTIGVVEFLKSAEPVEILADYNQIIISCADKEMEKNIIDSKWTTPDVIESCKDLKVLGKKDFRALIKWRVKLRQAFYKMKQGKADDSIAEIAPVEIDEADFLANELSLLDEDAQKVRKKEIKKIRAKKQKEMQRIRMDMNNQEDIMEIQTDLFSGKMAKKAGLEIEDAEFVSSSESESDVAEDEEDVDFYEKLERETNEMYEQYKIYRVEKNAQLKAREEWAKETFDPDAEERARLEEMDSSSEDEVEAKQQESKANLFFDHSLFVDVLAQDDDKMKLNEPDVGSNAEVNPEMLEDDPFNQNSESKEAMDSEGFKESKSHKRKDAIEYENKNEYKDMVFNARAGKSNQKPMLDTPDAVELALQIVRNKEAVIDDSFNRYAYVDEGLPKWFSEDERKHTGKQIPISKEAVQIFKDKVRAVNAQPAKKELEAQMRKRRRTMNKAKKIVDQVARIDDDEDLDEKQKAISIAKVLAKKQTSKHIKKRAVVVAKGANKGLKKRPHGVKGKYKMVDRRLKKDLRADKRIAKRDKPKRRK